MIGNTLGLMSQAHPIAWKYSNTNSGLSVAVQNAVDAYFKAMHVNNTLATRQSIHLIIGGTASAHKWNALNPADTDAAFRLTFSGTIIHNSSGMTSNGSTGWCDTKYNHNTHGSLNDHAISIYIGTNVSANAYDFSAFDGTNENQLVTRTAGNLAFQGLGAATFESIASSDSRGFWTTSRTASNVLTFYKNGSAIINGTLASVAKVNFNYGLMCRNASSRSNYSTKRIQYASIGSGMTAAQAATEYAAVQALQTSLSRNV